MTVFLGSNVVLPVCSFSKHDFDWLHFCDSRLSGTQETQKLWEVQGGLVPRPFSPPVFDCLQYARMKGEGLGDLVTSLTSDRHEGRHRLHPLGNNHKNVAAVG